MGLLQPLWLLLLPVPVVGWWWRRRHPRAWPALVAPLTIRYPLFEQLRTADAGSRGERSALAEALVGVALLLAVLALAQPVRYTTMVARAHESEAVDLVIVAGTAISMTLRDYVVDGEPVDRMTLMRQLLDAFVGGFSGRRIGLVVLGNPPALWLPLTTDRQAVRDAVARLRPVLGGRLSDMGATLQLVDAGFRDSPDKVVVLVTDGGLQLGDTAPRAAAEALARGGNTLYVIGIGASAGDAHVADAGGLLYEPLDPVFLGSLADAGGGAFFHARDAAAFSEALKTIEARHRRAAAAASTARLVQPLYPQLLATALALLLFALLGAPGWARRATGPRA